MGGVLSGSTEAVAFLLEKGADFRIGEKDGYTPPHGAGFQGRADIVEEKFGAQNFRVFSEMRGKILHYDPKKLKKTYQNQPKCKKNAVKI